MNPTENFQDLLHVLTILHCLLFILLCGTSVFGETRDSNKNQQQDLHMQYQDKAIQKLQDQVYTLQIQVNGDENYGKGIAAGIAGLQMLGLIGRFAKKNNKD